MYLQQFFDPKLELHPGDSVASLEQEEIRRIQKQAVVVAFAFEVPRRLGADASSDDLAIDKKRCKRVLHVLAAAMRAWATDIGAEDRPIRDEDKAAGASLDWGSWWADHQAYLERRRNYIASWAIKNGEAAWGNRAATRLENELKNLQYAMR